MALTRQTTCRWSSWLSPGLRVLYCKNYTKTRPSIKQAKSSTNTGMTYFQSSPDRELERSATGYADSKPYSSILRPELQLTLKKFNMNKELIHQDAHEPVCDWSTLICAALFRSRLFPVASMSSPSFDTAPKRD